MSSNLTTQWRLRSATSMQLAELVTRKHPENPECFWFHNGKGQHDELEKLFQGTAER